jgi:hypothetical protein
MGLVISKGLTLRKGWQPMDPDAAAYITAVETADDQALEEKTKIAIDNFVLGCKADGIWNAIKASCILAGARTRLGALTPLVGTAPTSFNFVDGDYNRKTGLVGNGSTKYLNSNRNNNTDPQDDFHFSCFASTAGSENSVYLGLREESGSFAQSEIYLAIGQVNFRTRVNGNQLLGVTTQTGFLGASRSVSTTQSARLGGRSYTTSLNSASPQALPLYIFARALGPTPVSPTSFSNARIAFYSIGESLNLALLDARVTDLINAFAAAIP